MLKRIWLGATVLFLTACLEFQRIYYFQDIHSGSVAVSNEESVSGRLKVMFKTENFDSTTAVWRKGVVLSFKAHFVKAGDSITVFAPGGRHFGVEISDIDEVKREAWFEITESQSGEPRKMKLKESEPIRLPSCEIHFSIGVGATIVFYAADGYWRRSKGELYGIQFNAGEGVLYFPWESTGFPLQEH